jgi:uncharacterized protein (DUF1330 family)
MKRRSLFTLSAFTALGMALGSGLAFGQGKPKAYYVSESEVIDPAAVAAFVPAARAAITAGGGRLFRTGGGRIVGLEGVTPKRVVIIEWDSVEAAEAFYKSKPWTDLAPLESKAQKTIRKYIVEALN